MTKGRNILFAVSFIVLILLSACYSNNCPLENTVTCNYQLFDSEGKPCSYNGDITVSTLMPGHKNVYEYKKLGYPIITLDSQDSMYINMGYSEVVSVQRNDSMLLRMSKPSLMKIPVSYFHSSDTLVFKYSNISLKDTIKIVHDGYAHVELPECGACMFHVLKSAVSTDYAIDSIAISNPHVTYDGNININIYLNGVAE